MLTPWPIENYAAKCEYASVSPQSLMAVTQLTLKLIALRANEACTCVCACVWHVYLSICRHFQMILFIFWQLSPPLFMCVCYIWTAQLVVTYKVFLKTLFDRKESSIFHSALALNRKGFICSIIWLLALFVDVCVCVCVCTGKRVRVCWINKPLWGSQYRISPVDLEL